MEHNCASYNLMRRSETEGHRCELNNSTHEGNEDDLEENPDYVYRGTKVGNTSKTNPNFIDYFSALLAFSRNYDLEDGGYKTAASPEI